MSFFSLKKSNTEHPALDEKLLHKRHTSVNTLTTLLLGEASIVRIGFLQ